MYSNLLDAYQDRVGRHPPARTTTQIRLGPRCTSALRALALETTTQPHQLAVDLISDALARLLPAQAPAPVEEPRVWAVECCRRVSRLYAVEIPDGILPWLIHWGEGMSGVRMFPRKKLGQSVLNPSP
jgi:hypothetical protein